MPNYHEDFVSDAMDNLGTAFEYAVLDLKYTPQEFMDLFISTRVANSFAMG